MALQRNLKALGTFGYQTATRGNTVYIQHIPRDSALRAAEPDVKYPRFEPRSGAAGPAYRRIALGLLVLSAATAPWMRPAVRQPHEADGIRDLDTSVSRQAAPAGAPPAHCRLWLRDHRALRHADALRLSRSRRGRTAARMAEDDGPHAAQRPWTGQREPDRRRLGTNYSLAAAEPWRRSSRCQETRAALRLATVPYRCLVRSPRRAGRLRGAGRQLPRVRLPERRGAGA